MSQPSIKPQYGTYGYQQPLYRPVRDERITPVYKDGEGTGAFNKKSKKLALLIWALSPAICLNNLYTGKITKAVHIMIAYVLSSVALYSNQFLAKIFPYFGSTMFILGTIGMLALLCNWGLEFFQIVLSNSLDERSSNHHKSSDVVKSKTIALLFCFCCGVCCAHNLYLGRVHRGVFLLAAPWMLTAAYLMIALFMKGSYEGLATSAIGLLSAIFILGMFINWIIELFQILSGRIVDDYGRMVQLK